MNTPSTRHLRPRHVPTPKMSDRKKDLFGSNSKSSSVLQAIDEDSDLGPMNPLEFSSSPKSDDKPLEHRRVKHLNDRRRIDFSNIMEQLSPAIKKSCRISQPDDSPKKIVNSPSKTNIITKETLTELSMLDKENCVEELLKTPVVDSNAATVPRISFRKIHSSVECSGGALSPNSRKTMQRRKSENKLKNDASASDSPKAKASLTFAEISAKSFYGTSNIEPIIKRQPVERTRVTIKESKKRPMSVPNRRYHDRRSIVRKPILGSIRKVNHQFKVKKDKLNVSAMKQKLLLDQIEQTIDNSRLKKYFKDLQSSNFDKQLISGQGATILKESNKSQTYSMTNAPFGEEGKNHLSDEEIEEEEEEHEESLNAGRKRKFFKTKSTGTQHRYKVTKNITAAVERGHGIKLLSPPKKKVKVMDESYDELLLIQKEVLDIVKRLSSSNNVDVNDIDSLHDSGNVSLHDSANIIVPVASDQLESHDTEMNDNISIYDKYLNMIPYNTTESDEINRQQTVLQILIENGICNDENFKIFISEHEQHKEEAEQILNNLFEISVSDMDEMNETSALSTINDVIVNDQATLASHASHASDSVTNDSQTSKTKLEFHPIFYKEHRRSDVKKDLLAMPLPKKLFKWIPISDNQLQIDAGQKEFGSKTCSQCGMFYTLHDPEDEILHQKFHNNMMGVLTFKGWTDENLVKNMEEEWGNNSRIIWVNKMDTKSHVSRIVEVMEIVNKDLGFSNVELHLNSIVYLAISRKHIIGVCVAEPLKQAHPMYTENQVEYIDSKTVSPVKCGISRIWVTPQFRRHGVATRLIQAVCSHFIRGYTLSVNEIAFSTPTVMGKHFAQKIATNVLVYDRV